jgi:hypothetical protein
MHTALFAVLHGRRYKRTDASDHHQHKGRLATVLHLPSRAYYVVLLINRHLNIFSLKCASTTQLEYLHRFCDRKQVNTVWSCSSRSLLALYETPVNHQARQNRHAFLVVCSVSWAHHLARRDTVRVICGISLPWHQVTFAALKSRTQSRIHARQRCVCCCRRRCTSAAVCHSTLRVWLSVWHRLAGK